MNKLFAAVAVMIAGTTLPAQQGQKPPRPAAFSVFEASIPEMQAAM
jgi:hypothetical protein